MDFFFLLKAQFTVGMEELRSGRISSGHDSTSISSESCLFSIFISDLGNGRESLLFTFVDNKIWESQVVHWSLS